MIKHIKGLTITLGIIGLACAAPIAAQVTVQETTVAETTVNASTDAGIVPSVTAGILPDSRWYNLKTWWEDVRMTFTFDQVRKAELAEEFASRRLAEVAALVSNGKTELAQEHLGRFEAQARQAETRLEKLRADGKNIDDVLEIIEAQRVRHQEVLQELYEQVPEQAQARIIEAMESSATGMLEVMGSSDNQEAVTQFKDRLEEKIQEQVSDGSGENADGLSDLKARLQEQGREMMEELESQTEGNTNTTSEINIEVTGDESAQVFVNQTITTSEHERTEVRAGSGSTEGF